MTRGPSPAEKPIDRLMENTGLSRWPTVYIYLFASVAVFLALSILVCRELLRLNPASYSRFQDLTVVAITLGMVWLGGGVPRGALSFLKYIGISLLFFFFCALPASLLAGILYGIVRASFTGQA